MEKTIVNIGCGMNIIPGAINLDNSPSVRLARHKLLRHIVQPFVNKSQKEYISFAITNHIVVGDALKLPFADNSVDLIYTSHMIEHLDLPSMDKFITECHRCLKKDGFIRIVTPDLDIHIENYHRTKDAIGFACNTLLYRTSGHTFKEKLRMAIAGDREHKIIYNGETLSNYISKHGFTNISVLKAGSTAIPYDTGIDLYWKADESLYVEAQKS